MLLSVLNAAALAAAPLPSDTISADFVGHVQRNAGNSVWERYDLRLTNRGEEAQTLSFCPKDAQLFVRIGPAERMVGLAPPNFFAPGGSRVASVSDPLSVRGFASAIDGDSWSYSCTSHTIAPDESADVSLYFRWLSHRKGGSPVLVDTSLGQLLVQDGKVTVLESVVEQPS